MEEQEPRRGSRRARAIIIALVMIVLCISLAVAGTYSLFTDSVSINNHLEAGTLKITLVRTAHSYTALDSDGYLTPVTVNQEEVNANNISNAFGLGSNALIAPQSVLSAKFEIRNRDTVAYNYSVKLVIKDESGNEITSNYNALHNQLKLELTDLTGTHYLNEKSSNLTVNGGTIVEVNKNVAFTVKLTFIDDTTINNLAQGKKVYFDIVVMATQATTRRP